MNCLVSNPNIPFCSVDNNYNNLQFDISFPVDDKYKRDLDDNEFYAQRRSVDVPKSAYISLDNVSLERETIL